MHKTKYRLCYVVHRPVRHWELMWKNIWCTQATNDRFWNSAQVTSNICPLMIQWQVSCPNTQRLVCGSAPKRTRVRASLVCCCNRCRHPKCCPPVLPLFSLRCFYSEPSILHGGAATTTHVCGRGGDGWRQQQCSS
jgi:hypothetical protein